MALLGNCNSQLFWVLPGPLNGWPSLVNLELRSIDQKQSGPLGLGEMGRLYIYIYTYIVMYTYCIYIIIHIYIYIHTRHIIICIFYNIHYYAYPPKKRKTKTAVLISTLS